MVNGVADGLAGVVLDRYDDNWQLQFFDATWMEEEASLCAAITEVFHPKFLVVKERLSPAGKSLQNPVMRVVMGDPSQSVCTVREGSAQFQVDLLDTVNPGLFLDMRDNRLQVAPLAAGGELLNLFCYTGSFSVHARLAGATRAVNVDVSHKILERVRTNYQLNGITPVKGEFFCGDSEEYLRYAVRKGLRFRVVVLDPPSFSRSERGVFQVKERMGELIGLCAQLVEDGGWLFVSTNHSEFTPDILDSLALESCQANGRKPRVEWQSSQGEDFPGSGTMRESCLSAVLLRLVW